MPALFEGLNFKSNPFEHYTAETEPHIVEYAVRPPYLQTAKSRALGLTSFILFGDRGAGKSATRITLFNELWRSQTPTKKPLVVNFVDFARLLQPLKASKIDDYTLIKEVAFNVIEQTLSFLASLADEEREVYTGAINKTEKALVLALVESFYLDRPELERQSTTSETLRLLNRAWTTKSTLWAAQRWESLSKLVGAVVEVFSKKYGADVEIGPAVAQMMASFSREAQGSPRIVLSKLVEFVQIFGFSGIVVVVDKVDETALTQNSADMSTRLIYPVLSHVQLLEIAGFCWMFFLWSQIKPYLEGDQYRIRLDKIAHATIEWETALFHEMLVARASYFSDGKLTFVNLFAKNIDIEATLASLIAISMRSPRELVRLMDVIDAEHDIRYAAYKEVVLIDESSLEAGQDKYVKGVISAAYSEKTLGQIYRLKSSKFINKDVQGAFRIGAPSARNKIKGWEDAGLVKQTGSRTPEGDQGGKPAYEYSIVDTRVERIINRKLIVLDEIEDDEGEGENVSEELDSFKE